MKIEYRPNFKDFQEATKFVSKIKGSVYFSCWFVSFSLIVFGVLLLIFVFDIYTILCFPFIIIVAIFLNPEVMLKFSVDFVWKNYQSAFFDEAWELEILEEGLSEESQNYKFFIRWPAFTKFIETPNLFVLYTGEYSYMVGPIPKRSFHSSEQIQEFKSCLNEKISESN